MIIIAPSVKLTGVNEQEYWFKIVSVEKRFDNDSNISPKLFEFGKAWSTDWVTIDIVRISSWLRCFDSTCMAFLSYCENTNPGKDATEWVKDVIRNTDVLEVMGLHVIEHRRCSSTMGQNFRYLAMKMVSMERKVYGILNSKFMDPPRSRFQIFMLKRALKFCRRMSELKPMDLIKPSKRRLNEGTGNILETDADDNAVIPRMLTKGTSQNFSGLLSEMYIHMMFNKDEGKRAHASRVILKKIVKEEEKLRKPILNDDYYYLGYDINDDNKRCVDILNLTDRNKGGSISHLYSSHCINIGSKLQMKHDRLKVNGESSCRSVISRGSMNKTLDKYATFKASTQKLCKSVRDIIPSDNKRIEESEVRSIMSKRSKCVETVLDYLNETKEDDHYCTLDVLESNIRDFEVLIQIFKKNQIGGTREILILDIKSRIIINYLEEFCKGLCRNDKREMLTEGKTKFNVINQNLKRIKKEMSGSATVQVHRNLDMSKWCQSFMPFQFFYMLSPYRNFIDTNYNSFAMILIAHQNKKIEYPVKLVYDWLTHRGEEFEEVFNRQEDQYMNRLRKKFLNDYEPYMVNESNMGQGILHFTSSLYHCCLLSFRDKLFRMMIDRLNVDMPADGRIMEHDIMTYDAVSSDDRYTYFEMRMKGSKNKLKLLDQVFDLVTWASESLFGVINNDDKGSKCSVIAEFNSQWKNSFNAYSPLIKFAYQSVPIVDTRSFKKAISECFSVTRQLRDNGATSWLTSCSHILNKRFYEELFKTGEGMVNNPVTVIREIVGHKISRNDIPYDLGVYPIYDPEKMDTLPVEYHNYMIMKNNVMTRGSIYSKLLSMFYLVPEEDVVNRAITLLDLETKDYEVRSTIEISMGAVRQLENMKKRQKLTREMIVSELENPLVLLRKPEGNRDCHLRAAMTLFTSGASDSLRRTNSALYYARSAALATASCWSMGFYREDETKNLLYNRCTYSELIKKLIKAADGHHLSKEKLQIFFPLSGVMDEASEIKSISYTPKYKRFDENDEGNSRVSYRMLKYQNVLIRDYKFTLAEDVSDILGYFWFDMDFSYDSSKVARISRDWENMKSESPILRDSIDETLDALGIALTMESKYKLVMEMIRRFTQRKSHATIYMVGNETSSYKETLIELMTKNSLPSIRTLHEFRNTGDKEGSEILTATIYQVASAISNYVLSYIVTKRKFPSESDLNSITITYDGKHKLKTFIEKYYFQIMRKGTNSVIQKTILLTMMILNKSDRDLIMKSLFLSNNGIHSWIRSQSKKDPNGDDSDRDNWFGPFSIQITYGKTTLQMRSIGTNKPISLCVNNFDDLSAIVSCINRGQKLLQIIDNSNKRIEPYLITGNKEITSQNCMKNTERFFDYTLLERKRTGKLIETNDENTICIGLIQDEDMVNIYLSSEDLGYKIRDDNNRIEIFQRSTERFDEDGITLFDIKILTNSIPSRLLLRGGDPMIQKLFKYGYYSSDSGFNSTPVEESKNLWKSLPTNSKITKEAWNLMKDVNYALNGFNKLPFKIMLEDRLNVRTVSAGIERVREDVMEDIMQEQLMETIDDEESQEMNKAYTMDDMDLDDFSFLDDLLGDISTTNILDEIDLSDDVWNDFMSQNEPHKMSGDTMTMLRQQTIPSIRPLIMASQTLLEKHYMSLKITSKLSWVAHLIELSNMMKNYKRDYRMSVKLFDNKQNLSKKFYVESCCILANKLIDMISEQDTVYDWAPKIRELIEREPMYINEKTGRKYERRTKGTIKKWLFKDEFFEYVERIKSFGADRVTIYNSDFISSRVEAM
jgi:hypothetical protein